MSDIVLCRILGTAIIQQLEHYLLDQSRVCIFSDDVILMKDVAEVTAVIELCDEIILDVGWQRF